MPTLVLPSGRHVAITPIDVLYAAKLAHFEGADTPAHAAAIIWTISARMDLADSDSFAELAEHFSQALSPAWRADGPKCRLGGQYAGTAHCTSAKLERRARAAAAGWSDLSPLARAAALRWASGTLPNPVPGAVDFASGGLGLSNPALIPLARSDNGNVFFARREPDTRSWPAPRVVTTPGEGFLRAAWRVVFPPLGVAA